MPFDWSSDVCRSEEHTSELQSHDNLVCRLLLEKKKAPLHHRLRHPAMLPAIPPRRMTAPPRRSPRSPDGAAWRGGLDGGSGPSWFFFLITGHPRSPPLFPSAPPSK